MLNTRQAAKMIGIPQSTIYRYIKRGVLPAHKLGGNGSSRRHWRLREQDVEVFISGQTAVTGEDRGVQSNSRVTSSSRAPARAAVKENK